MADSTRFSYLRRAHRNETPQDYVELIAELLEQAGEARIVDLAQHFGVSQATVHKTVGRLKKDDLVLARPYRGLFLTPKGKRLAQVCKRRHEVVYLFLCRLGIDEETAAIDAEGIEHHVSEETLKAFQRYLDGVSS